MINEYSLIAGVTVLKCTCGASELYTGLPGVYVCVHEGVCSLCVHCAPSNTVYTSHTHRLPPMSRCRRSMCRRHLKSLVVTVVTVTPFTQHHSVPSSPLPASVIISMLTTLNFSSRSFLLSILPQSTFSSRLSLKSLPGCLPTFFLSILLRPNS